MTSNAKKLRSALIKTINPDGLKGKIVDKFMGYIRQNIKEDKIGKP